MIDHPIAGPAGPAVYLDGPDWTVTSAAAPPPPAQTTTCEMKPTMTAPNLL